MTKQYFDIGIVIPLPEEFGYAKELFPQLNPIQYEGTHYYRLDLSQASAICCLVGQMGTLPAMNAALRLLRFAELRLLVLLGVAGAVDSSVDVGDVVVAEEVNEFQASSKAQSIGDGYEVQYSGRHWPLEFAIKEAVRHFEFSCPEGFSAWQGQVADDFAELDAPNRDNVCSLPAKLHIGPIASGNIVAASSAFLDEVRRINRKFVAIDMEAAGVAFAATERTHRVPCLVLRGVSDHGDEHKAGLDDQAQMWRRYSVRNAVGFLRGLIAWEGFRAACEMGSHAEETGNAYRARELASLVHSHVGATWLVGIAFGLYSHGPQISVEGNVVPMDLSRLRILDSRVARLVDSSVEVRERLLRTGDLQTAAEALTTLVDGYRNQVNLNDVDVLLGDFDRVIVETLSPSDDDQLGSLILEADRLEENIGPEAAAEYLSGLPLEDPRLRQRYVEALSVLQNWTAIIDILQHIELDQLSRDEYENLMVAHANSNDIESAKTVLRLYRSRYDEPSAQMFQEQLTAKFVELRENGGEVQ